jgi:hypothetical protein
VSVAAINGILVADIAAIDAVAAAAIAAVNGQAFSGGGGGPSTTTWSTTDKTAGWIFTNGDLTVEETTSNDETIRATGGISPGDKVYFEILIDNCARA